MSLPFIVGPTSARSAGPTRLAPAPRLGSLVVFLMFPSVVGAGESWASKKKPRPSPAVGSLRNRLKRDRPGRRRRLRRQPPDSELEAQQVSSRPEAKRAGRQASRTDSAPFRARQKQPGNRSGQEGRGDRSAAGRARASRSASVPLLPAAAADTGDGRKSGVQFVKEKPLTVAKRLPNFFPVVGP